MQVADRHDEMDGIHPGIRCKIDIMMKSPYIGAAFSGKSGVRDQANGLAFTIGCGGGTRLDDMYTDIRKCSSNLYFFRGSQGDARRLFTIPKGGVKKT
jgi:hypothetical protein